MASSAGLTKRAALLLLATSSFAIAGCNKSNPEPTPGPAPSPATSVQKQAKTPASEETTSAVIARIESKGFHVQNLGIIRSGTVLKLSGVAKTEADKKGAEDVARASPGVTDIQSSITLAP